MTAQKESGDLGEELTANYLKDRGYQILDRQWRCKYGELDLVARDPDGILCFVEVKLRGPKPLMLPREAVTASKRKKLRTTASIYLSNHHLDAPARFDVSEVFQTGDSYRINYLEDAFS